MIRTLFLVADSEHAEPLNTAKRHFADHGIAYESHGCGAGHGRYDRERVARWLEPAWDVVLTHQAHMPTVIEHARCPIIIIERIDGGQLAQGREWLEDDRVNALIKSYSFRDPSWHNKYNGRVSAHILRHQAGIVGRGRRFASEGLPEPQLSEAALAKIKLGWNFASGAHMNDLVVRKIDFKAERSIDLHFAGTLAYSGSEIEAHRRLALAAAMNYKGGKTFVGAGRVHSHHKYRNALLDSKVVLSPWGCGEPCHRDYEALLAGCMILKPDTGHITAWPDVFSGALHYVPCRHDFADVPERMAAIKKNWNHFRGMREAGRRLILGNRDGRAIAEKIAPIIKGAVS